MKKTRQGIAFLLVAVIATMMMATGCTGGNSSGQDTLSDTLDADTLDGDTLSALIEETPMPKAADEFFDDFIYNFAASRRVQKERIDFPLKSVVYGKATQIQKGEWKIDHFFMRQGFYTMIVGDMKELEGSKNPACEHVVIEKIFLRAGNVKQYVFNRVEGLWKLQEVCTQHMKDNANGAFYQFYARFVSDSTFQQRSLADEIRFSGPDPEDDFSRMDGVIMPEQWSMFVPVLPNDMIYNIIYGNVHPKGSQRILVVRGIANGLETELTFRKSKNGWQLCGLNI